MQDKRNIENVVQEIMGLVGSYGTAVHDNSTGNPSDYTLAHAESAAYNAIESKLREIVENSLSVREPLSNEMAQKLWAETPDIDCKSGGIALVRKVERAHGITNTSKVERNSSKVNKWTWMMDWCKAQGIPPADARVWALAENAFNNRVQ